MQIWNICDIAGNFKSLIFYKWRFTKQNVWKWILKLLLSHDSDKLTSKFLNDFQCLLICIGIQKYKKNSMC